MTFRCLIGMVCLVFSTFLHAQSEIAGSLKKEGVKYYEAGKYDSALSVLLKYHEIVSDDPEVNEKIGACFFLTNETQMALSFLTKVVEDEKTLSADAYFYLAKTLHAGKRFKEAAKNYKLFLKTSGKNDERNEMVKDELRRCVFGMKIQSFETTALVENLGEKVNSPGDDFRPILSPNHTDRLYFSSNREGNLKVLDKDKTPAGEGGGLYSSDMFSTTLINGEWGLTNRMNFFLNSPAQEVVLDFSTDGSRMYFFRGPTLYGGEILIDTFRQKVVDNTLFPPKFNSPLQAERGDGAPYFFNDTILLFASRREGGFGGLDLYITKFTGEKWTEAENLGATINSPYDETSPFLARDGRTLYFSSNYSRRGIGGLDIFKATYVDQSERWTSPENLKLPINSAGDDDHFRLTDDGLKAFFSSSRRDGFGGRDLYVANFPTPRKEQLNSSAPITFEQVPASREQLAEVAISESMPKGETGFPKKEIPTYEIAPLFYEAEGTLLTPVNIQKLNSLLQLLNKHPQLKVCLTGHSNGQDSKSFDLFFSIKMAEKAGEYLVQNGILASKIILQGVGSAYPVAKNEVNGKPNPAGGKLNRRIEITIHNTERLPLRIIVKEPRINDLMANSEGNYFKTAINSLSYKVQIASIKQMYHGDLITRYRDAMVERNFHSEFYDYSVGLYQTFNSADELRKDIQRNGVAAAKVVPYIHGLRISKEQAASYAKVYPDLGNFHSP